jgi:hypothetical protein
MMIAILDLSLADQHCFFIEAKVGWNALLGPTTRLFSDFFIPARWIKKRSRRSEFGPHFKQF